jgi:hypothetical protein
MGIMKYWRILATVVVVTVASIVSNLVSGIESTVSGAVAVNQMNGGNAGYIAAHAMATNSSFVIELIIALIVVALMIAIWAPAVKRWVNNSK